MQGRLQKIISAHGVASRRAAERLIADGRVYVNGAVARVGDVADDEFDDIMVDGAALPARAEPVYIMLNKPVGYVTSMKDDFGRNVVTSLVSDAGPKVYPVGRLDMDSGGLLLMTNDGRFANMVMHPSFDKTKTYEVRVRGDADAGVKMLRAPVMIDEYTVQAVSVAVRGRSGTDTSLLIEIAEGRNRQIRRMCEYCGLKVLSLNRIAIGALKLGGLEPGKWRYLTDDEVSSLLIVYG